MDCLLKKAWLNKGQLFCVTAVAIGKKNKLGASLLIYIDCLLFESVSLSLSLSLSPSYSNSICASAPKRMSSSATGLEANSSISFLQAEHSETLRHGLYNVWSMYMYVQLRLAGAAADVIF